MKLITFLMLAVTLVGCGKKDKGIFINVFTPDFITKEEIIYHNTMEATPFHWTDGRLLYMVSKRHGTVTSGTHKIEIYDEEVLISSTDTEIGLKCAIMNGNRLYVFGATDWSLTNEIKSTFTEDLVNWSPTVTAIPKGSRKLFNSSVTQLPSGKFVMAFETCEAGTKCFSARFATSDDLITWTEVGEIFKPNEYAACPTIRFVNGKYYVFWLKYIGHYATYVSRSSDLVTWEDSKQVVLSALKTEGESINNSDMDLVEHNGEVVINYAIGNQKTSSDIKRARYHGTLEQFVKEFF